jgi:CBS domain-containing protein
MTFNDARENFVAAARYGLKARLRWFGGRVYGADELIRKELVPLAREGLLSRRIAAADVDRYLDVIEARAATGRTGAQWMLDSLEGMGPALRADERYRRLTGAILSLQREGRPVHEWPLAQVETSADVRDSYRTVEQIMTSDLFTVHPEDLVDLAASVMDWEHLRHVPVEDHEGHLVGLVTHRHLLRLVGEGAKDDAKPVAVREIMRPDPVTVTPETSTLDAIEIMRSHKVGCLPVVRDGRLVGIVTETDFIDVSAKLLDRWLREE